MNINAGVGFLIYQLWLNVIHLYKMIAFKFYMCFFLSSVDNEYRPQIRDGELFQGLPMWSCAFCFCLLTVINRVAWQPRLYGQVSAEGREIELYFVTMHRSACDCCNLVGGARQAATECSVYGIQDELAARATERSQRLLCNHTVSTAVLFFMLQLCYIM